jgi:hypothetical protein
LPQSLPEVAEAASAAPSAHPYFPSLPKWGLFFLVEIFAPYSNFPKKIIKNRKTKQK